MKEFVLSIEERRPSFWFVSGSGSAVCCDLEDVDGNSISGSSHKNHPCKRTIYRMVCE
jgi:hypothetical protein